MVFCPESGLQTVKSCSHDVGTWRWSYFCLVYTPVARQPPLPAAVRGRFCPQSTQAPWKGRCSSSRPQIQIQNSDHSSVHPCDKIREGKSNLNCFLLCIKPAEQAQIVVYWNQKGKPLRMEILRSQLVQNPNSKLHNRHLPQGSVPVGIVSPWDCRRGLSLTINGLLANQKIKLVSNEELHWRFPSVGNVLLTPGFSNPLSLLHKQPILSSLWMLFLNTYCLL